MVAIVQDIVIEVGSTFTRDITLTNSQGDPLDVSGMTANAAIALDVYANTVLAVFETNLTAGMLTLRMEANDTLILVPGIYIYDATISNGQDTFRIAEGLVQVDGGVSGVI